MSRSVVPLVQPPRVRLIRVDASSGRNEDARIIVMIGDATATLTMEQWSELIATPERTRERA